MDTSVFSQDAAICSSMRRDGEEEPLEIAVGLFCTQWRFLPSLFAKTVEII